jgi:predicted acylesterase/phospholipase RssA
MEIHDSDISNLNVFIQNNNNQQPNYWTPDVIVLGPGGAKGFLELGLLLAFEKENYYSNTRIWLGCSVGSAIALLVVCGYTITEIVNDCMSVNIINDITDVNLDYISEKPGLLNIKSVKKLIKLRVRQKFGMIPTLKQLYMITGLFLELVTFNVDKQRPEYLSKDTEPNLSCVKATLMSMSIPGLICPQIYKGHTYVDGALGDPYPILEYDDNINRILGVYIDSEHSTHSSDKNPIRFLYRCAQASMKRLRDRSLEAASNNCKHIPLKTPILDTTGLSLNNNMKKSMIEHGYKTGIIFINRLKYPEKYRLVLEEDEELPAANEVDETRRSNILDNETLEMLNMLSDDRYVDSHPLVFNDGSNEDLFISDLPNSNSETLFIPITPDIRRNIQRMYQERSTQRH